MTPHCGFTPYFSDSARQWMDATALTAQRNSSRIPFWLDKVNSILWITN